MAKRPIIGVSGMNVFEQGKVSLVGVRPAYLRALEDAEAIPLFIHLTDDLDVVRALYAHCDGILLPGGDDVDPAEFNEAPHPALGEVDKQRDRVELALTRWCAQDRKPLLGICRGAQVLNVALGGTLYQDLPSQRPDSLDHRASMHQKDPSYIAHRADLAADSWLAETLGAAALPTNTLHHQAVREVAPQLRAVAWAEDGVIEAVEHVDAEQFLVGVQCHPERMYDSTEPGWQPLFAAFVARCRR